jgi:hypothetical protein
MEEMNTQNLTEVPQDTCQLIYNTQRKNMPLPEYGRSVQKMVDYVKSIEEREKRNEQARAVIKVMERVNPAVHLQENYEQKLWDHLHIIADFELDVDSPYPIPDKEQLYTRPEMIPIRRKPIKATHYGRNIESIIELIIEHEEGEVKDAMIRQLAIYMRQQYLIWNKDTVADETIFSDIEKLSDYKIKVPEGMRLTRVASDMAYNRPGNGNQQNKRHNMWQRNRQKNNRK